MIHLPVNRRFSYGFLIAVATLAIAALSSAEPGQSGRGGGTGSSRVVGIIVQLEDTPVATYQGTIPGLPATSDATPGTARLRRRGPAAQAYRAHLARKHAAFEATVRATVPAARITHRFDIVLGGVAMRVPESQVSRVAQLPGVKAVFRDPLLRLHTDTSPRFIGAASLWGGLQGHENAGEGIVVGVLDSGVWPEHPSFSDPDASGKPYPPPPTVPAQCDFAGGANPGASFTCNHKLIGAYRLMAAYDQCVADAECTLGGDFTSARDGDGHGTHTMSTAAGNAKVESQIFGINRKQISGIAPRAHVIAYKICGLDGCLGSDAIAAIQQAILDDVDVINFSIGGGTEPYRDVVELAFLDAYAAGIFVAASAGNEGPGADTVNHRGPWVTTVAASSENRSFQTTLSLGAAGGAKLKLTGVSITPGIKTPLPVVMPGADTFCASSTPADLAGKIVVCERGVVTRLEMSFNVAQRGAAGMILLNNLDDQELLSDNHSVPSVHVTKSDGDALKDFLATRQGVTASFAPGVARNVPGDVMAQFSSRGGTSPTLGVSKPDITAPGVQILAAQTPEPDDPADPAGQLFQAIAGTSMSSPHVAGAAALLKHANPDWTPGQIKSALMTTASTTALVKEDGVTPYTPFDAGSGRLSLQRASSPGLTFDVPASDYVNHAETLWTVNHPSVYIPDIAPHQLVVQRTARSLASGHTTWKIAVVPDGAPGLIVTAPSTLTVPSGGSAPIDIQIDKSGIPAGQARHATLRLTSGARALHMPITAAGSVARPDLIVTEVLAPSTGTRDVEIPTAATVQNAGSGTAGAFYFQVYLSQDNATVSADDTPYWFCNVGPLAPGESGSCAFNFPIPATIPAGTYFLVVRADDGGVVQESNEGNNVRAAGPITIN